MPHASWPREAPTTQVCPPANAIDAHFMTFETLTSTIFRLQTALDALAALGAELRMRREGLPVDRRLASALREVITALEPTLLDGMTAEQESAALVIVQAALGQANELMTDPARPPGWSYDDPAVLQGQGQASRRFVHAIEAYAERCPDLRRTLREPGAFLDVGTGVGWLAIEAARTWPALRCVGIDIWEPALRLARANLAGAGMDEWVELRTQSVEDLAERDAFTLAWLPPFIPLDMTPVALRNLRRALVPGGWLVVAVLGANPDPLSGALSRLKLARYGTYSWTTAEAEAQLGEHGFEQVATFSPNSRTVIIVGRKPAPG